MLIALCQAAALLFAAGEEKPARPPAHLVVPKSMQKDRTPAAIPEDDLLGLSAEMLQAAGPFQAHPGEWVEYSIRLKGEPEARVRLSILAPPPEAAAGRYWLEAAAVGAQALPSVVKMLVHGDPLEPRNVERLLLYVANQAPIELPVDDAKDELNAGGKRPTSKVHKLPAAQVTVPAGTFHARGLRFGGKTGATRLWLAPDEVPLWGLVRSVSALRTVELLLFGKTGAHSVLPAAPGEAAAQGKGSE